MHMVVVGGGPTGVEYAGELHDFLIVSLAHLLYSSDLNLHAPPRTTCESGTLKSPTSSESP